MNVVTLSALIEIKLDQLIPAFTQLCKELNWGLHFTEEQIIELDVPIPLLLRSTGNLTTDELEEHGVDKISSNIIRMQSHTAGYLNTIEDKIPGTKKIFSALAKPDHWLSNKLAKDHPQVLLINNHDFVELHMSCKRSVNYYHRMSYISSNKIFLTILYLVLKERLEAQLLTRFSHFDVSVKEETELTVEDAMDKAKDFFGSWFNKDDVKDEPDELEVPESLYKYCMRLKQYVAEAETSSCFIKLDTLFAKVKSKLHNGFVLLLSHFNELEEKINAGIVSMEQERLEHNRINHRLLFLIDNLDDDQSIVEYFIYNKAS